jgi:hypothetical protein
VHRRRNVLRKVLRKDAVCQSIENDHRFIVWWSGSKLRSADLLVLVVNRKPSDHFALSRHSKQNDRIMQLRFTFHVSNQIIHHWMSSESKLNSKWTLTLHVGRLRQAGFIVGAAGVGEAERRTHTHAVAVRAGRVHVVQEEPGV